jgi:hypothetical protein
VKLAPTQKSTAARALACGGSLMLLAALRPAPAPAAVGPAAEPPYSVSTFAVSENGYTAADSITFSRTSVFIGYGNGGNPDGSGGAMSTIVKYKMDGTVVKTYTVVGHNDGLRYNTETGDLWALQNEDSSATLIIIDPATGKQRTFTLGTGPHGGGYDDLVFFGDAKYISASNPSVETAPGLVQLKLKGQTAEFKGILNDDASATDVTTGNPVTLKLTDPDSLMVTPYGELLLDSQGDGELIIVQHPGKSCQNNLVVPLTSPLIGGTVPGDTSADDTVFANAAKGTLLVADKDGQAVYAITAPYFAPGAAYSAIVSTSTPGGATIAAFVGQTDLTTGLVTPIVNGLENPGGMAFVPADGHPSLVPQSAVEKAGECP